jgi:hypothetical protein
MCGGVYIKIKNTMIDDTRDKFGGTVLHTIARLPRSAEKIAAVRSMLALGAKADARDNIGRTPLHVAVWVGDPDAAAILARPCDLIRTIDDEGVTPMDLAIEREETDVIAALVGVYRERALTAMMAVYRKCGDYQCSKMVASMAFPEAAVDI